LLYRLVQNKNKRLRWPVGWCRAHFCHVTAISQAFFVWQNLCTCLCSVRYFCCLVLVRWLVFVILFNRARCCCHEQERPAIKENYCFVFGPQSWLLCLGWLVGLIREMFVFRMIFSSRVKADNYYFCC
jgi:hypothetical protein